MTKLSIARAKFLRRSANRNRCPKTCLSPLPENVLEAFQTSKKEKLNLDGTLTFYGRGEALKELETHSKEWEARTRTGFKAIKEQYIQTTGSIFHEVVSGEPCQNGGLCAAYLDGALWGAEREINSAIENVITALRMARQVNKLLERRQGEAYANLKN